MNKRAETFEFTKKNVIILIVVFALIIALPTSIFAYELFSGYLTFSVVLRKPTTKL